jgi:2-polyprenyl-3-methyl-5-hydroxy-6-metoxy-1,4-benzoquinol methylase
MTFPAVLEHLADAYPATSLVAETVLKCWPEHERYIRRSLSVRSDEVLETTEMLARAALTLAGPRLAEVARHYRWTCDRLHEEEIEFHRSGRYRLSSFTEADREVYSNSDYMEKYVDGLLFSQVLWVNHAESCNFFFREIPRNLKPGGRLLEIGPGHGLMLNLAMSRFGLACTTAWDISPVAVEQTRRALALLGAEKAELCVRNIMEIQPGEESYDLVVLSEILEHLEDPKAAMRQIRGVVGKDGLVFVNVPINSPSPDHLYLMQCIEDAEALLTETGFIVMAKGAFATQGHPIEKALRNRISVSVCMLGRLAG